MGVVDEGLTWPMDYYTDVTASIQSIQLYSQFLEWW